MLLEPTLTPNPTANPKLAHTRECLPEAQAPVIWGYRNRRVSEQALRIDGELLQISQKHISGQKSGVFAWMPRHLRLDLRPVTPGKIGLGILSKTCHITWPSHIVSGTHPAVTQFASQELPHTPNSGGRDALQSNETQIEASSSIQTGPSINTGNRSLDGGSDEEHPPDDDQVILFRSFSPYNQPKSTREINEAIKAELLKPHPAATGFIYGFAHPDNVFIRLGTGPLVELELVKIGRSDNVVRRMQQWRKQCKYNPRLMFAHVMAHHQRIERVIHHQLHSSRLREHPGCSGCGVRHTEWFRVEAEHAESIVIMWQGFTEQQPYDEGSEMLPGWLERLEHVDLDSQDCWSWFTCGAPLSKAVSTHGHARGLDDFTGSSSTEPEAGSSSDESAIQSIH